MKNSFSLCEKKERLLRENVRVSSKLRKKKKYCEHEKQNVKNEAKNAKIKKSFCPGFENVFFL